MMVKNREGNLAARNPKKTSGDKDLLSASFYKVIPLLLFIFLLTNCAPHSPFQETVPNQAESRDFDMKASIVRKAVEQVLTQRKFTLNPERSNVHHLQTEWLQDGMYRNMVQAEVKPLNENRSELTLYLILQKKQLWKESWQPLDEIGKDAYGDLMDDVQIESYRILYDGG